MKRIAIVTGASSGMGMEFVKQIKEEFKNLDEIWVIARRTERLEKLADELSTETCEIVCLSIDLTDARQRERFARALHEEKPYIKVLVNAAGYGKVGSFSEMSRKDLTGMAELNCVALTDMTHMCLKYMKKGSVIFQFASAAAFLPQPRFAVYAATKSYVLSLSRALNRECKKKGILVTTICPGPVNTEFFEIAEKTGTIKSYKKLVMVEAQRVVAKAISDAKYGKTISVYGFTMKAGRLLAKLVPHELLIRFFG